MMDRIFKRPLRGRPTIEATPGKFMQNWKPILDSFYAAAPPGAVTYVAKRDIDQSPDQRARRLEFVTGSYPATTFDIG